MADTGSFEHFFEVDVELFNGPIDLLLHLVKKHELSIEKLSLAQIATQYMGCLERMRRLDLEIAAEYLVIAATLLSIKASVLLNEPVEMTVDDDGNVVDPHEELLRRLREANIYREGAFQLACRQLLDVDVFAPPSALAGITAPPAELKSHDPMSLGRALQKLIDKVGAPENLLTIAFEQVSIVERMMNVLGTLQQCGGRKGFRQLIPDITSRSSIIITFIALLELCKRGAITTAQSEAFEDIDIVLTSADVHADQFTSEFDAPLAPQAANNG